MFGLGPLFQMSKEKTHSTTNMFLANKLRGCFRAIAKSSLKRTARIKALGSYESQFLEMVLEQLDAMEGCGVLKRARARSASVATSEQSVCLERPRKRKRSLQSDR